MALTKIVTHGPISAASVALHLELKDDDAIVIDRDFSESYTQAVGLTADVRNAIKEKMQKAIDDYKLIAAETAKQAYIDAPGVVSGQLNL